MKLTKLQIVQKALAVLDLDEVSSIGETIESEQISMIVDSIYDDMNGEQPWPHLREFSPLEITATPHTLKIPSGVLTVDDVWYLGKEIQYMFPKDMLTLLRSRDTGEANVDTEGAYNDRDPSFWSSVDDTYIIFDAYSSGLVSAHSLADVYKMPAQMVADNDYPDLPERFHQTLFQGVVADAFYALKGDVTGFNIWRNRYKKNKAIMDRWMKTVNRQKQTGEKVDYGRKRR